MTILIVFLILFGIIFLFAFLCARFDNPYQFYMHIGKKGSGKSTTLAALAQYYSKKHWRVFCTERGIHNTEYIPSDVIGCYWFPEKSVLLIDEIGLIWHSRSFSEKGFNASFKKVREWFKYSRHNKVIIHAFSQSYDIDKGLRDLSDVIYLHSVVFNLFGVQRTVARKIALNKIGSDGVSSGISEEYYFAPGFGKHSLLVRYLPKYRKLFNSFCKLDLPSLPPDLPVQQ